MKLRFKFLDNMQSAIWKINAAQQSEHSFPIGLLSYMDAFLQQRQENWSRFDQIDTDFNTEETS